MGRHSISKPWKVNTIRYITTFWLHQFFNCSCWMSLIVAQRLVYEFICVEFINKNIFYLNELIFYKFLHH